MRTRLLSLLIALLAGQLSADSAPPAVDCDDVRPASFAVAQNLYRSGQFVRALAVAESLCHCFPGNVDYQFLRALSLNALGRRDDALAAGRTAEALAPDYRDVTDFVRRLQDSAPGPAAAAATHRSVIATAGAHSLSNGRDGWDEQSLGVLIETADGRVGELRLDRESRGSVDDLSLAGRLSWPLSDHRRIAAGLMLTPSATFRPEQLLTLEFEQDLPAGWVARAGINHRRFVDDRAEGLLIAADRYYGAFRFSAGINLASLDSAGSALSQVASVDWYRSDRDRYRVTLGYGRELDTIDDGTRVLETRVRAVTVSGQHQLSPRLAIGWWLGTLEQGDFYDRHYAGLSLTRRY